jgi:hypothetical protein
MSRPPTLARTPGCFFGLGCSVAKAAAALNTVNASAKMATCFDLKRTFANYEDLDTRHLGEIAQLPGAITETQFSFPLG